MDDPRRHWLHACNELETAERNVKAIGARLEALGHALKTQPFTVRTDRMRGFSAAKSSQFDWLEVDPADLPDYQSLALMIELYHFARAELLRAWQAMPEGERQSLQVPADFSAWTLGNI